MKSSLLLLVISLFASTAIAQAPAPGTPGIRQADQAQVQFEKSVPPPLQQLPQIDPAKLKHDADQLASLAQSVPAEIDSVRNGTLPKDLIEKLKQVEKLSKHLRSELMR